MIDLNDLMERITVTARVANVDLRGKRRFYWRLRASLWLFHLAGWVGGWLAEEVGVDADEMGEDAN